jgi:amidase
VLAVPSGKTSHGVPTGIQIVGKTYRDADVFRFGIAYESIAGACFSGPDNSIDLSGVI